MIISLFFKTDKTPPKKVRGFKVVDGATPQTPEGASLDEVLAHKTLATKAVLERMLTFAEAVCERLERLYAASGVALVAEATMELTMRTEPNAPLGATKPPSTMAHPVGQMLTPREINSQQNSCGEVDVVAQPKLARNAKKRAARKLNGSC